MLAQEHGAAAKAIDVCRGYLAVGLDQHHFVAKALKASLDCELDTRELSSITTHALLR